MAAHRLSISLALCFAMAAAPAAPALAQAASGGVVEQADALTRALRGEEPPSTPAVQLSAPRDISARMVDAEVFFNLGEWANCATLLAPALAEPAMANHPANERAHYLLAESLYRMGSLEVARTSFQRILDQRLPVYDRQATKRLLEIAVAQRHLYGVDQQYALLLQKYGQSADAEVFYILGRAQYYRQNYMESAQDFARVGRDSDLYWRAQYHRGISLLRHGYTDTALDTFETIETELSELELSQENFDVLQLARLAQGTVHYENGDWDEAVRAYSSVQRGSSAFEQALYQVAWTQIREDRSDEAITNLDVLSLIAQNSRTVAEAQLLSAEMMRRAGNYDGAIETFTAVTDDFTLIREQLYEIRDAPLTVTERFDASEDILTGTILAGFAVSDWFPADERARRGLEIVRESDELGEWVEFNSGLVREIDEALASGFAYDRALPLRDLRGALIAAQRQSVEWRASLVRDARATSPGAADSTVTEEVNRAAIAVAALPHNDAALEQSVADERETLNGRILDLYRREQNVLLDIDNLRARDTMLRDRVRLKIDTPEKAGIERSALDAERTERFAEVAELREERLQLHRERIRYGLGEAQSHTIATLADYSDALRKEQTEYASVDPDAIAALDRLDAAIAQLHNDLNRDVRAAWQSAHTRLGAERNDVARLDGRQRQQRSVDVRDAEQLAAEGFLGMLQAVDDVALRASLGEVDVAWWQKDNVSRRIDSLFRERERQIRRLDADFSEIRE